MKTRTRRPSDRRRRRRQPVHKTRRHTNCPYESKNRLTTKDNVLRTVVKARCACDLSSLRHSHPHCSMLARTSRIGDPYARNISARTYKRQTPTRQSNCLYENKEKRTVSSLAAGIPPCVREHSARSRVVRLAFSPPRSLSIRWLTILSSSRPSTHMRSISSPRMKPELSS